MSTLSSSSPFICGRRGHLPSVREQQILAELLHRHQPELAALPFFRRWWRKQQLGRLATHLANKDNPKPSLQSLF